MVKTLSRAWIHVFVAFLITRIVEILLSVDREVPRTHPHTGEVSSVLGKHRKHLVVIETVVLLVQITEELRVVV